MSRNTGRLLLTIFIVVWALYETYPPRPRDLVQVFQNRVEFSDTNFTAIVARAQELQQQNPDQPYQNLLAATGTNELSRFFPSLTEEEDVDKNRAILNRLQQQAAGKIKLGLDLQGGSEFLVSLDESRMKNIPDKQHAVEQAIEVLRKRVDAFGVAEPVLRPAGESRIVIQIPGMSEDRKESAKATLMKVAFLEFRLVHPESAELVKAEIIEPGYELLQERSRRRRAEGPAVYLVKRAPEEGLTGSYVKRAYVSLDPMTGKPKINLEFNSAGAEKFGEITRNNVGRQLGIVLDGELYSAPSIRGPILGGSAEITGDFEMKEAFDLANALQNPLEAPVKFEEERGVDPSLGRDSIRSGVTAAIIGTVAVVLFMLVYYLLGGVVANLALILNIVILIGVLCKLGTTLTLPGIAGVVLTIGMAVDANVLIFERIREELAAGKSLKGALAAGYDKAFGTIFDSNLTTLISAVILIFMGTGPVKGFGVTLTVGILASMYTALLVTRLVFDWLLARGWLRGLPMLHLIRSQRIDFLRFAPAAFTASWLLIAVGNGYGLYRGHAVLGVDFAGGDRLVLRYQGEVNVADLRQTVTDLKLGDVTVQKQRDLVNGTETVQLTTERGSGAKLEQALKEKFPSADFKRVSLDQVGATIGREIQRTAVVAVMLSLFGILIYVAFRYEFSFAVGAVLAIIHDVLMTMGWFFLSGRVLSAPIVAAILTIIGFSINDTIVIFDRIREDLKLGVRGTFRQVMNAALNQTLSRTIITSGTVFLATLSLYLFGGGVINDFAFTFLVGILTGTYSSIYIASALVLWWHKGQRPKIGAQFEVQSPEALARTTAKSPA